MGEPLTKTAQTSRFTAERSIVNAIPWTTGIWLRLLREQLMRTLDHDIAPLGKQGARGVLLCVTLGGYGYTFVAKGTVLAFVDDLKHEALVYRRLQPLQGVSVPVFLGAVDLDRSYYYDFLVRIIHMMFLGVGTAWAMATCRRIFSRGGVGNWSDQCAMCTS